MDGYAWSRKDGDGCDGVVAQEVPTAETQTNCGTGQTSWLAGIPSSMRRRGAWISYGECRASLVCLLVNRGRCLVQWIAEDGKSANYFDDAQVSGDRPQSEITFKHIIVYI